MGYRHFSEDELTKLIQLRHSGFSISEIAQALERSKTSVAKRVAYIPVLPENFAAWRAKRGGSALRANARRSLAKSG